MKHRALSMLLALVMVVSLLPIAAIANGAEENTAAEERKETVEMRENDSQQGGDGEKSQLPTEENEKTAIQLYVEKKGGATSYTRYQYDENVRLPWLVYVNESDNAVVPAFLTFFQSKAECYAIQKAADGTRTKFGQIEIHTNAEGLFALWKDFPKDLNWSEAEKADYVLMFHCNGRWYKFNAQLRAGSAPLVGELVLQYNGTNYSGEDGMILPAGVHQVALTLQTQNGRMFFAPRVFEYIENDYKLREDVRKEIEDAGYIFKLELLPTDHGCEYYPVTIPVELDSVDPNTERPVTETWEQHLVTEKSVGSWIYKVSIVKKSDGIVFAQNMSMASYLPNVYTYVPVTGNTGETISKSIKAGIKEHWDKLDEGIKELVETGRRNDFVVFQLPSGEINGQIEIPDTLSLVTLRGAGFEDDLISTTIRGGVKLGDVSCNIDGVHFIGDGTTNEYLADGVTRNSAIYGKGQGVYNGCIFENYYCAIHSSEDCAPAWGGWSSVFYKNGTALHLDTDLGGNLEMVDNWFVGNSTAILMDDALEEIYFLQARQNRFVNNDCDLVNNCGKTMWMSQNFFYHAAGSEASWEPVLWEKVTAENSDDVIGLQLKRKGENGAILAENMPAFETTENYNALGADGNPQYLNFLPRFDGSSKTMAYPLARTQECVSFFYPNWRNPNFCPQWWSKNDPYYPSYVQQGVTISENELDGLRFSSYDSASDKAVGTFEFSASAAETEN